MAHARFLNLIHTDNRKSQVERHALQIKRYVSNTIIKLIPKKHCTCVVIQNNKSFTHLSQGNYLALIIDNRRILGCYLT